MAFVREATLSDIRPVAEVFASSFSGSVAHYVSIGDPVDVLADMFSLCLVQKGHFLVVEEDGLVAGYVIAPYSMRRLVLCSLVNLKAFKIALKFLLGRYGIRLSDALRAALNSAKNLFGQKRVGTGSDARILSIAVSPYNQGRGYGRLLLGAALEALSERGVKVVRLEVRPDNLPALRLYRGFGFKEEGTFDDSQGKWTVMVKGRE